MRFGFAVALGVVGCESRSPPIATVAPPAASSAPDCYGVRQVIQNRVRAEAAALAGCFSDADCVVRDASLACQYVCPLPVAGNQVERFNAARAAVEAALCGNPRLAECQMWGDCRADVMVRCIRGHCSFASNQQSPARGPQSSVVHPPGTNAP